jgi:hypothetical protein
VRDPGQALAEVPKADQFGFLLGVGLGFGPAPKISRPKEVLVRCRSNEDARIKQAKLNCHHRPRAGLLAAYHLVQVVKAAVLRLGVKLPSEVLLDVPVIGAGSSSSRLELGGGFGFELSGVAPRIWGALTICATAK